MLISASRDKTLLVWNLSSDHTTGEPDGINGISCGKPVRSLKGHGHFVQDVVISSDGQFALSASWDGNLRLWDLNTGASRYTFVGHEKDVLSCAFSPDNRQIISGGRDKTIRVWNTVGTLIYTIQDKCHSEWVSSVSYSPNHLVPRAVSCGWDKKVKVWDMQIIQNGKCDLLFELNGHDGYVNCVIVSPDGSLCASGGKDGVARLWDINEGKELYKLEASGIIYSLVFSPTKYWLCAATEKEIKVFDLEKKACITSLAPKFEKPGKTGMTPYAISLSWSSDGNVLYAGYTDNMIRVWAVDA